MKLRILLALSAVLALPAYVEAASTLNPQLPMPGGPPSNRSSEQTKPKPKLPETAPQSPWPINTCISGRRRFAACYNPETESYEPNERAWFRYEQDAFTCPKAYPAGRCCSDPPNKAHGDWGCVVANPLPPPPKRTTFYCLESKGRRYAGCYNTETRDYLAHIVYDFNARFDCPATHPTGLCCFDPRQGHDCIDAESEQSGF